MAAAILYFINDILISLSLIITVTLVLYIVSIRQFLKEDKGDILFSEHTGASPLRPSQNILLGIAMGFMLFFISHNIINLPVPGMLPMDIRYLLVFFIVYYGSPIVGFYSITTLSITKLIQYMLVHDSSVIHINNTILMYLLLIIASFIYKRKIPPKRASYIYLGLTLLLRIASYDLSNAVTWTYTDTPIRYLHLLIFILTMSGIFLFTSWFINQFINISQQIGFYQREAIYDKLTNLYKKDAFFFFLNHARNDLIYHKKTLSVAIIDIDNFKQINDNYGHLAGDKALVHTSHLLLTNSDVTQEAKYCRLGGDEIGVVFNIDNKDPYDMLYEKFKLFKKTPLIYKEQTIDITLSCGLVIMHLQDVQTDVPNSNQIFTLADEALYEAKKDGKNKIMVKRIYLNKKKEKDNF